MQTSALPLGYGATVVAEDGSNVLAYFSPQWRYIYLHGRQQPQVHVKEQAEFSRQSIRRPAELSSLYHTSYSLGILMVQASFTNNISASLARICLFTTAPSKITMYDVCCAEKFSEYAAPVTLQRIGMYRR
ncbi:hypothetical protein JZ785_27125 [Alicyclobacillus curvatus]|nr:hypothetical protein JZ785_27125 [Alicyclobacillus curvatus]